jgi:hypothetical protein|uniref:Uncharacterized protein n=1 Tax=virus sp. ctQcs9 TaxID=2825816 RepID=A0A8S5R9V0_9VIRU|nr:MAG TPA: hypothetical protein [virus sp. ctQcs9]
MFLYKYLPYPRSKYQTDRIKNYVHLPNILHLLYQKVAQVSNEVLTIDHYYQFQKWYQHRLGRILIYSWSNPLLGIDNLLLMLCLK